MNFLTISIKFGSEEALIEFIQAVESAPHFILGHCLTKSPASSMGFSYLKEETPELLERFQDLVSTVDVPLHPPGHRQTRRDSSLPKGHHEVGEKYHDPDIDGEWLVIPSYFWNLLELYAKCHEE